MELDIDIFRAFGLMLGAGMVVYGRDAELLDQAENCTQFFRNESCGKCVPCRLGTERLAGLAAEVRSGPIDRGRLDAIDAEVAGLREALQQTSICGLGVVAPEPLSAALRFYRDEIPDNAEPRR
jgi:NADH:ubiquinone oxidoreductase subunit F (NADH-binding)